MSIIAFDIDGTLSKGPFNKGNMLRSEVNLGTVRTLRILSKVGYKILIVTARPEIYRPQTEAWLRANAIPYNRLVMRSSADNRPDPDLRAQQASEALLLFDDKPENCSRVRRCVLV